MCSRSTVSFIPCLCMALRLIERPADSGKDMKEQKHVYEYDACGNLTYEYMRENGTGEATVENTYTYDALHRVVGAHALHASLIT